MNFCHKLQQNVGFLLAFIRSPDPSALLPPSHSQPNPIPIPFPIPISHGPTTRLTAHHLINAPHRIHPLIRRRDQPATAARSPLRSHHGRSWAAETSGVAASLGASRAPSWTGRPGAPAPCVPCGLYVEQPPPHVLRGGAPRMQQSLPPRSRRPSAVRTCCSRSPPPTPTPPRPPLPDSPASAAIPACQDPEHRLVGCGSWPHPNRQWRAREGGRRPLPWCRVVVVFPAPGARPRRCGQGCSEMRW
jgi:hypothetical protein